MIPTYVFGWPKGSEVGEYLAIDLGVLFDNTVRVYTLISRVGGTNLRVCHVNLEGGGKFEITQTKYKLTEEQKQEEGSKLCAYRLLSIAPLLTVRCSRLLR